MKIGAENKKELVIMVVLLAIAIPLAIYMLPSVFSGTSSAAAPAPSGAATPTPRTQARNAAPVPESNLDPRLRLDILAASQHIKYQAGGRNIFRMEEPPPPKVETTVRATPPPGPPTPTPTPPPPPINLKFYGFANKPNEPKRVFLVDNDELFVAKQGDIVERRYRVVQISNTNVLIEDVLNNNKQPIPLTVR